MAFDFMNWLVGSSPGFDQTSRFTEQQQGYQNQLIEGLGGPTGAGMDWLMQILSGNPEAFQDFEAPIMQQFEQEIIPGISERFAGMGTGGAQNSSAFQQTLGRAGRELSTQLGGMRAGLKQNALQLLQGFQNPAFAQGRENVYNPGGIGVVGGVAQGLAGGAGKAGANYFLSGTGGVPAGGPGGQG